MQACYSVFFRLLIGLMISCPSILYAQIPQLNSRPGAAYTLYLNFEGFSFTGNWGGSGSQVPGVTPAYSIDANTSAFNATELANIHHIWSRVAEKYRLLNVNVTTIDPAPLGSTDAQRQAYYDQNSRLMHTVIGGSGGWSNGGGISFNAVAQNAYPTAGNSGAGLGFHTNWAFSAQDPSDLQFVAEVTAHEIGHTLKLRHQSQWSGSTKTAEYDPGSGTGSGTFAPIMGDSYAAERGLWRIGATSSSNSPNAQNDLAVLLTNSGIAGNGPAGFMDSGIGHTLVTATPLPLLGSTINSTVAAGFITPLLTTPIAIGEQYYTQDLFSFTIESSAANLQVNLVSGRSTIIPGVADPGAMLNATLRLLDSSGTTLLTSNSGVLLESLTTSLSPGQYYLQISSAGGASYNGYDYFDVGSYFLTGSVIAIPEPSAIACVLVSVLCFAVYRRRLPGSPTRDDKERLTL